MLGLGLGLRLDAGRRGGAGTEPPAPVARGALPDKILLQNSGVHAVDASSDFTGASLGFAVTGEGVAIDPATGRLSIATDRLLAGVTVTVTAANAGGTAVSRFRLTVAAAEVAPALLAAPVLVGSGLIGAAVSVDPGQWGGVPAPALALQWLIDGVEIPGAVAAGYLPQPSDDTRALACRVTASNPAGSALAVTPPVAVARAAPAATGQLPDLVLDAGAAPGTVAAAAAFEGAALTFAVNGRGATIDSATGLVTIATGAIFDGERITVTASNSGGSATSDFLATVRATPPVLLAAPALAGSGRIGAAVTVSPGVWGGVPTPALGLQWLSAGAEIAGATASSFVPGPAQDLKPLSCRVTASNAAGSAEALTAALAVTEAPPVAVAALADVSAEQGAVLAVEAAAAFAGAGLRFSVAGGGATVDALTGRVLVPTAAEGTATVTVTASNSGGSASAGFRATVTEPLPVFVAPLLVAMPVLAGSASIGQALTLQGGAWSGVPEPVVSQQWLRDGAEIPGATGTSYTPVPADDRKTLCCRATASNPAGSAVTVTAGLTATYVAPVARGALFEEIFDVGSGVQTVAAGADFVGAALSFAVTGAGATIDPATGVVSIPTDYPVSGLVTVTATNSGGAASSAFRVTVEDEETPFALEAEDIEIVASVWRPQAQEGWFTPVLRFPGLAGEVVDAVEWTTGKDPVPEAQYEVAAWTGDGYQLYMRDPARNLPGAVPRVDYSVWKAGEARRDALRLRWRRTAQGPWSAPSAPVSVPVPATNQWLPLVARNRMQFEAGQIGGPGMQFLRDFATSPADPDLLLCPMDQNFPWASKDFGRTFFTPDWNGLWVGRSGVSAWIDPTDANRQLLMYSAGSQSFDTDFDAYSGLYLSTDGGKTAVHVLSLPLLTGTTSARHNMRLIAHAPGGTPATRTIYAMQVSHGDGDPNAATIQLWRSAQGGAVGSWSKVGVALAASTYAGGKNGIWGIAAAPNGDLYIWGETGAWRSPAGADVGMSWTKLATLPAGKSVHFMDVAHGGGVIWACVEASGLYKATDGATFAKNSALGTVDTRTLAISPADRNYMVIQIVGQQAPSWSHDGGASWTQGTTNPAIGQEDNFSHGLGSSDHYGLVAKINDRMTFFAHRSQHMGISKDGGVTFDWTGRFYDGSHTHDIGFHPTDWRTFAQAQQDRGLVLTQTGGDYWLNDQIGGPKDQPGMPGNLIITAIDNDQHISGAGTIIHASGRVATLQGNSNGNRVLCLIQARNGDPLGDTLVRTDCVSNLSDYASLDPHDGNSAFMGKFRLDNLNAVAMTGVLCTEIPYHFVGVTGAGGSTVIYGVIKDKTDKLIYRSTDRGASWTPWRTAAASFRPVDVSPVVAVCPHHSARVYAASGAGKVVRIEGISAPTETLVFDARSYLGAGLPKYAVNSIAVDPFNQDLLYVSLFMWGVPNVFRSTDRGATWEDVSGTVPSLDGVLFIHPLTSDVVFGSSHGSWVLPPPAGHRQAYGITGSVYDRVRAFLDNR
jgi:PKD repeat protein